MAKKRASRQKRGVDAAHRKPIEASSYMRLALLKLSDRERVELAHKLWAARSNCLLAAPLLPSWSSRLLDIARVAVQVSELLVPSGGEGDRR